ncbi:MAG TPA: hypothetical protein ENJ85_03335, partial [Oceanithermus profundus]|nr:hypothetical protein [Oceanithermus profundus]
MRKRNQEEEDEYVVTIVNPGRPPKRRSKKALSGVARRAAKKPMATSRRQRMAGIKPIKVSQRDSDVLDYLFTDTVWEEIPRKYSYVVDPKLGKKAATKTDKTRGRVELPEADFNKLLEALDAWAPDSTQPLPKRLTMAKTTTKKRTTKKRTTKKRTTKKRTTKKRTTKKRTT